MLLTTAAGSAYSLRHGELSRVMMATTSTYALGLAIASLWNVVAGKTYQARVFGGLWGDLCCLGFVAGKEPLDNAGPGWRVVCCMSQFAGWRESDAQESVSVAHNPIRAINRQIYAHGGLGGGMHS